MDLGAVTKWREDVRNCLHNGHHNDIQGRLGLQSNSPFSKSNVRPTGSVVGSSPKSHVRSIVGSAVGSPANYMSSRWRGRWWDWPQILCRVDGGISSLISCQLHVWLVVVSAGNPFSNIALSCLETAQCRLEPCGVRLRHVRG